MVTPGLYRHYKGPHYRVLFIAKNSTNGPDEDQNVVIYVSLSVPGRISARLEREFEGGVPGPDFEIARFTRVGE